MADINIDDSYLPWWQAALRLQDWDVELRVNVPASEMPSQDTFGDVEYVESVKRAVVYIVDPATLPEKVRDKFVFEQVFLHEMLHLKLSLLDDTSPLQDRLVHQLVDDLAKAFVTVKESEV